MYRSLSPYEKNQLLKYGLSADLPIDNQTPVEYLTGHVDFCGHDFLVTRHTLIPRVETQEIIDLVSSGLKSKIQDLKSLEVADIGTGSGALGISLSLHLTDQGVPHQLYLSDISLETLTTARLNALRLLGDFAPSILQSDLFDSYPQTRFNIITANLPYIPTPRVATLDASVKDYEPRLALDGGPDGSTIINRLLQALPNFTKPGSVVLLEVDHTHTLQHFHLPPDFEAELIKDSLGQTRFLRLKRA